MIPKHTPPPISVWTKSPWKSVVEEGRLDMAFSMAQARMFSRDDVKRMLTQGDFSMVPGYKGTSAHKDEVRRIFRVFLEGVS